MALAGRGLLNRSSSHLAFTLGLSITLVFLPTPTCLFGGLCHSNLAQRSPQSSIRVNPTTDKPSTGTPIITSMSCNVMVISLWGKWNECVSDRHLSTNIVINAWSTFIHGSNPPSSRPFSWWRQVSTPGTSYKQSSLVLIIAFTKHVIIMLQT